MQQQQQQQVPQEMSFQTPSQGYGAAAAMDSGAMGNPMHAQQPPLVAMKMKGLPFSVQRQDIVNFFTGHGFVDNSIKIGVMADGRLTGEAVIMFNSADDCQNA